MSESPLGLFNGGKSLCFTLVARRIAYHTRNKLLSSLMDQDKAFFDGTTAGRLTSRLTNDVNTMLQPIVSTFSTTMYNVVLLIGGVVMCFYTSYQLSMLAFTCVTPILYLCQLYGTYSKRLNRLMLMALSEANSVATQALSNISTVKACSMEVIEMGKYMQATKAAMIEGIRDAWAFAGTSMVTSYMDLGTGILILWVGGNLAIDPTNLDKLTVGKLVAFQMYWNTMNNAYQQLQSVFMNLTRAAAGAERVFSLLDSTPDIDPHGGAPVDWPVAGRLQLDKVHFHYQMRPDNKVLSGIDLDIPAGTTCALVGRSGGGKSTIISLLLRRVILPWRGE